LKSAALTTTSLTAILQSSKKRPSETRGLYCPHVNPLDSTGFLWTPNPIYLYEVLYKFLGLDWTGTLLESTEIPVLLESCGLETTELQENPQDSRELKGNPQDQRGVHRTTQ